MFINIYSFWNWLKLKITKLLFYFLYDKKSFILPSLKTNEQLFIENETNKFLSTFNNLSDLYNKYVDSIFYDIIQDTYLMTTNNDLETKWKSRILFTSTPRGNIIMHYNCYKKGFSYYCDSQTMSYELLNVIAMKYVRMYMCRDLYIDNKFINNDNKVYESPLIKLFNEFEKNEKQEELSEKYKLNKINKNKIQNAPFVKFKKPIIMSNITTTTNLNISTNNFIYLGKICNFTFLQKNKSNHLNKNLCYKDFLRKQKK
jgi:hypothetical protein